MSVLTVVPNTGSTNRDLVVASADPELPDLATLVTTDQTAGRGRRDRTWVAPAGSGLAVSVLLRGRVGGPLTSWIPLVAGLAMVEALDPLAPGRVALKWPNDVLLDDQKVCGILVEVANGRDAVVGAGVNLRSSRDDLPFPAATSLLLAGLDTSDDVVDRVLDAYLGALSAFGSEDAERLHVRVAQVCSTLGQRVRVDLPAGDILTGWAHDLDDEGRLEVRRDDGSIVAVSVGDVIHVRTA